jgi:hypothetical protein
MKDLMSIVDNNLGADRIRHTSYELNGVHYIIYKEHDGDRCVVLKDDTTFSPFFNNLIEADTWINTNS